MLLALFLSECESYKRLFGCQFLDTWNTPL
jgi:hypothetical protein